MSATAQAMMRSYAANEWPEQNHKGRMRELARHLGFGHRRTRALYQNEDGVSVRADEMERIAALRRRTNEQEARDALRASQAEYRALEARIAALEELFRAGDEEHGRPFMDAFRTLALGQGAGPGGSGSGNGPNDNGDEA